MSWRTGAKLRRWSGVGPNRDLSFTSFSASQKKQEVTVSYEVLVSGATTVTGSLLV